MSFEHQYVRGTIIATTDMAVLLERKDDDEVWIPRSVIDEGDSLEENDCDPLVKKWFINKEGL